jgi:LPS sulfotransferase NodH
MPEAAINSYLICATPRTGSSLLCGLLDSAGVAGHPESYFRQPSEQEYAARWGIVSSSDGAFSYADYVRAAMAEGTTGNGVFAARIMWGTLDELVARLGPLYPDMAGAPDLELLCRAFGRTRFVYLRRGDVVAQAVSLLRAEQTDVWHDTEGFAAAGENREPAREPCFDFGRIEELIREIEDGNLAWQRWFGSAGVQPHLVRYEELEVAPVEITLGVLGFLGLRLAPGRQLVVRHKRLADEISSQWIASYLSQRQDGRDLA